jgi:hypothetical protein
MTNSTSSPLNHQHIVACLWDFDKTLSPGYMQGPIFKKFGIDEETFWKEANALPDYYAKQGVASINEIRYLNHMLTYVREGLMKGLSNAMLKELGAQISLCQGLPQAFAELKNFVGATYGNANIKLEHYILSTGLRQMILGSAIAANVDGIYACEFIEKVAPPHYLDQTTLPLPERNVEIQQVACVVDNTAKTRCIFELNKGCNKNTSINVNSYVEEADRRIPIENMIYIADGPSDVPAFSVMRHYGGMAVAVYNPNNEKEFAQTDGLLQSHRVNFVGPADYRAESSTFRWLKLHLIKICDRIASEDADSVKERVGNAPTFVVPAAAPIKNRTELL